MAKKISELPAATTPLDGTELIEVVQGGVSKQVASNNLGGGGSSSGTINSNLNIEGVARRILSRFSGSPISDRTLFQTIDDDSQTSVGAIPSGTSNISTFTAFSSSDPNNSNYMQISVVGSQCRLNASSAGTGQAVNMSFILNDSEVMTLGKDAKLNLTNVGDLSKQADITATTYGINGGGILHGRYARGTPAAPTGVLKGDIFSGVGGRAYHSGGDFQASSPVSIHWVAAENQTPTNYGSYLRFLTTPKGSNVRQERVIMPHHGGIFVHSASGTWDASNDLHTSPISNINDAALTVSSSGGVQSNINVVNYGASASAGIRCATTGGSVESPSATPANTMIGFITGQGYSTSGWASGAKAIMSFHSNTVWSDTNQSTYIGFGTTAVNSVIRQERLRIKSSGQVNYVPLASAPTVDVSEGDVYFDSTLKKLRCYDGTSWINLH
ncbi:hypothetical protein BEN71_10195 [Acinetobacter wuhouensis]|uniref:hypothetical protein n=1 Tax=Acinetobacter wuhouensis TaxID=1879050 RepID=UPI00083A6D03|nr:hypothetical protein [Acinetobacter wuhouensis]AXQ21840.1 hypothetical protein BEN71_07085 [Acinetobacter wuhouensis]AXQ22423.1 hypothetical protein BEN71_10195 [Acinetobacter wuhouensis]